MFFIKAGLLKTYLYAMQVHVKPDLYKGMPLTFRKKNQMNGYLDTFFGE